MALETKMETMLENQEKLTTKLDKLLPTYATKAELEALKKRHSLQSWLVGTLSGAFGVLLTILIQNYLSKR